MEDDQFKLLFFLYLSISYSDKHCCLFSDFITTLLPRKPKKLWIGLKDNHWVDNTPVKYHNFNPLIHGQLRLMYINVSVVSSVS